MAIDTRLLKPSRNQQEPIYLQLYHRVRDAIANGQLGPGDRVPSVRSLASELNVARGTVEAAWQMLIGEGYLIARGPAGTVVSPQLDGRTDAGHPATPAHTPSPRAATRSALLPFQLGMPALDAFPRKSWVRLAGRRLRSMQVADLTYPDAAGYEPLRRAIASYLGISRGIACSPQQVFITAGYRGALDLICRTLFRPGDAGWFEDPGYIHAREFLQRAGMKLVPVPVDDDGLNVEAGRRRAPRARFAVVTPTHQSPLGVALSLPRRLALLAWARSRDAWIVEDDYDSEFRYHGRPLPALKSLDRDGRVLYTGTFSKVLYPGLRLAYLVVPEARIADFANTAAWTGGGGSLLLQSAAADFIEQGHFVRHLKKMRGLYATRRTWLVDALTQGFGDALLHVPPRAGGIHVLAHWTTPRDDRRLAQAANSQGLAIQPLTAWCMRESTAPGMMLGFANLESARQAHAQVRRLHRAVADLL
ncbi:GntR family transcriptional regulator [Paraburkholderia caballeronis]|uniref:MocR-like pyridoxine biosynthesis transcription factor PdxR n=1 Tax=Paraburkholderia caballeronis TaxID=416943 RepID=UPI0010ECE5D7|nr:PLP-dependent aminotransferase family protein [Paraburkholderia caballeronis]TDV33938.1 GntR family transcriptional regulator [Paraburkholderia caballeronis]